MFKSIFFIFASVFAVSGYADNLKYLADGGKWKSYVPANIELIAKIGPRAFMWANDADAEKIPDEQLITRDPYLIFKPNVVVNAERKTKAGLIIYKTSYKFDDHSRRSGIKRNTLYKNIILLGCSYTLGSGLPENETIASYLSQFRKNYNVYNLGIYAAGANDILDDLRSFKRFSDIPRTGGMVVYTAIFDHFERSLCTLNCYRPTYRDWVLKKSNYKYDEKNKKLDNLGSFTGSRPLKGPLFSLLAKIPFLSKMNIPPEPTGAQIHLFVRLLSEMRQIAKEKLNSEFIFTFYPGTYSHWDRFKKELDNQQIKYLHLSAIDLKELTGNRHVILLDGHPSSLSNYLYANLLHQNLPKH